MRRIALALVWLAASAGAARAQSDYPRVQIFGEVIRAGVGTERAALRLGLRPDPDMPDGQIAVLEVVVDGERLEKLSAQVVSTDFPVTAGLVEMDPANDTPEIYLESYTGGAHCCTDIQILSKKASGGWAVITLGEFNGGGGFVQDVDSDGRYEVATGDEEFLYTFGCYACSTSPLKITALEAGEARDATFEPRFQERQRQYLGEIEEGADFADVGNGFLAGWVAQKIIVGEGDEAWAKMLESYDKTDDWGLQVCPDGGTDCAEAALVTRPFPDLLKEFLNERGYPI